MRGIIAIVLTCLLSLTAPLMTSASAADLGMPLKAPPLETQPAAVEFQPDYLIAGLAAAAVIVGVVACFTNTFDSCFSTKVVPPPPPLSPGANTNGVNLALQ
jgi:hypothetical protein